ncbi:MAG TPA: hypothetical protein VGB44_04575 [Flavobacterium sp.]|jgi:hypothetical protein
MVINIEAEYSSKTEVYKLQIALASPYSTGIQSCSGILYDNTDGEIMFFRASTPVQVIKNVKIYLEISNRIVKTITNHISVIPNAHASGFTSLGSYDEQLSASGVV